MVKGISLFGLKRHPNSSDFFNETPQHMTIAGNRVLVSYEGQPMTCYGCGDTGYLYQFCPQAATSGSCSDTKIHNIVG